MSIRISILQTISPEPDRLMIGSGGLRPRGPRLRLLLLGATLFLGGCIVSEADYNKVVVERDRLKEDITRARQENQILNQAILEVYTERETLVKRVSAIEKGLAEFIEPLENLSENPADSDATALTAATAAAAVDRSQPVSSPDPPPPPPEPIEIEKAPKREKRFYTTERGDRLSDVARRNAVPLDRLKTLNRIKGDPVLPAGKKLRIQ